MSNEQKIKEMEMLEATLIEKLHNTKLMEGSIKARSMQSPSFIIQPYSDSKGKTSSKNLSRAQSPYS